MANDGPNPFKLTITGRSIEKPSLPRSLQSRQRAASSTHDDPFLPQNYLRPVAAFDVSVAARSTAEGSAEQILPSHDGQVIAIDLVDGTTVFTSPARLRETLLQIAPDSVGIDGSLCIDKLRERGGASRGGLGEAASNLLVRITSLDVGAVPDAIIELARKKALEWLNEKAEAKVVDLAELGVSWLGTKALMWAIESQLAREPGLYRWVGASGHEGDMRNVTRQQLEAEAQQGSFLVFVHGTGSNTHGSFSDLHTVSREYWRSIEARFGERIFAFEHRTMSESPIENALQLARTLPARARINLISHSRGGLVADLLCLSKLDGIDQSLVEQYGFSDRPGHVVDSAERERLLREIERAHGENRSHLRELTALLREKQFVVERYVRVACPARGTRLASSNLDVFLSGMLSLLGLVPALAGSPIYSAFKRIVLEIAKNRTNPRLVPGIEAMLPESPIARLLARATPQSEIKMAVIAGDIEGGGLLKRLGVFFTDHIFFDANNNDLVVDTSSMYAGVALAANARALFDQGPDVTHFNYFRNDKTRNALQCWLLSSNAFSADMFGAMPALNSERSGRSAFGAMARGGDASSLPIVVLLPGIMGSHLRRNQKDRVWFDFDDLVTGGFEKLQFGETDVESECLFDMFYGDLARFLSTTHRVEPFPYDWRQPLDMLADTLAQRLLVLLAEPTNAKRPVRLLAHSMGGLVVRALIERHRDLWDNMMARQGARLVMLGTPNHGSHSMVETLIGKSETIRNLARIDLRHDLQGLLAIVSGFPGALALLPRPGFTDAGASQSENYFDPNYWRSLKLELRDLWFGDQICAVPSEEALNSAQWLWNNNTKGPSIPQPTDLGGKREQKVIYVHGCAPTTPAGLRKVGNVWKSVGTAQGDGTVTWDSGRIDGIDAYYWMPARHGALSNSEEYFESLAELLATGSPGALMIAAPRMRGEQSVATWDYEASAPTYPSAVELASGLVGGADPPHRIDAAPLPTLKVRVRATDLRFTSKPILVGHYEQDAISGAESVIDRELLKGALRVRYDLGMYAGPLGTATVALPVRNELERRRGSSRGAVVAGLGKYDGSLSVTTLTEAVRTAAVRYLLHIADTTEGSIGDAPERTVPLASLLIGYNSSANLSVDDAVLALVRGVAEANRRFAESTQLKLRIAELEIIEVHIDTAITATYALRRVAETLNAEPHIHCRIEVEPELQRSYGARSRLGDSQFNGYWERVVITSVETSDDQLRFLYLGQRARAESVIQQRQPGLVESLVAQQLHVRSYQEDFSRTLFQLLVPHEFKDAARQLVRVVLVLDGYTANLPWELMLADDRPLSVKVPLVRQLSSTRFRARARQSTARRAYIVGNPSSDGFAECFRSASGMTLPQLEALPAAENEATAVVDVLAQYGYDIVRSIGVDQQMLDVVNRLYKYPYRIVHIAAHGVFEQRHVDGTVRTGVVLSDGKLITAAEIGAMEVVPDLVFLNCCHLGKVTAVPTAYNRLSYSIARELIEMGVRAVVVAGWAVDDEPASEFAETFYRCMLGDKKSFGDAIFEARKNVWERYPTSMTWGAYQAYGDPGFRLEPGGDDYDVSTVPNSWKPVSPLELLAHLEQEQLRVKRLDDIPTAAECRRVLEGIELIRAQVTPAWWHESDIAVALGRLYAALGPPHFARAIECLSRAARGNDKLAATSLVAFEELANLEARHGEATDDIQLVRRAISRLHLLAQLTSTDPLVGEPLPSTVGGELAGILGSAYKRLGAVLARKYAAAPDPSPEREGLRSECAEALDQCRHWYSGPCSDEDPRKHDPYAGLNLLFLAALGPDHADASKFVMTARTYAEICNVRYAGQPDFWNAIMVADALLVEVLLDESFWDDRRPADLVDTILGRYESALTGVAFQPKEFDSTLKQMRLLAIFFESIGEPQARAKEVARTLEQLAQRLLARITSKAVEDTNGAS